MEVIILQDANEIGGADAIATGRGKAEAVHQLLDYCRETYRSKPEWQGI